MPWTAQDAHIHKHGLTSAEATQWAKVANSVLAACVKAGGTDETCAPKAIRQASGVVGKAEDAPLYTVLCKHTPPLRYTLGTVYAPLDVDSQGDFATAETIRAAAWDFMTKLQEPAALTKRTLAILTGLLEAARTHHPVKVDITQLAAQVTKATARLGDQHETWNAQTGTIVECYTMPCEATLGGELVTEGTWLLGVVWTPDYFTKILAGERTGYSLGGWSRRRFVEEIAHAL